MKPPHLYSFYRPLVNPPSLGQMRRIYVRRVPSAKKGVKKGRFPHLRMFQRSVVNADKWKQEQTLFEDLRQGNEYRERENCEKI